MITMGNRNSDSDSDHDRTMVERIDPLMGTMIASRYRVDFRLASGGFGAIYRATHVETGQQVAVKILHAELATADARVIARFRREGATLEQLKSPNTIQAYELGDAPDGSLYIVMELLHGESLYEQFRAKGTLSWQRVAAIGRQVCNSLAEAHALGIIHRDLKPANIHLEAKDGDPDFVKVLDFGIAKITRESELDSTELTQAGQMIGTFDYMAPEQMVGGSCSGKTDIYTLGIVLYEMITGRRPFSEAASPTSMLAALLTQAPPPLDVRGVPAELERILMKCLEREPQHRYEGVRELAMDLDRVLAAQDGPRKPHTPMPVIIDSEATVVAQPRARRGTPPHPLLTVDQRPRRGSEPPAMVQDRPNRDSSPPNPNVIRREGSSPAIPTNPNERAKRDSQPAPHLVRRDRDSQPVPVIAKEPPPDPTAWKSLPPRDRVRNPRDSAPAVRYDGRDSQPEPREDIERRPMELAPPGPMPQPTFPGYPAPAQPRLTPAPQFPLPPTPSPDPRVSLAAIDPNAWRQQTPPRGSMLEVRSYDMAGSHSRDVLVRRVVWTLALVLGVILIVIVASRLS